MKLASEAHRRLAASAITRIVRESDGVVPALGLEIAQTAIAARGDAVEITAAHYDQAMAVTSNELITALTLAVAALAKRLVLEREGDR